MSDVSRIRIVLGTAGVLLGLFGVFRLVTQVPTEDLTELAIWLVAAVVLHDGVLSPILVGIGWVMAKVVPPRARRYLQPALIVAALITVIALPMIHRQGVQPPSKAVLRQDYGTNLSIALAIVAGVVLLAYLARSVRDQQAHRRRPRPGPRGQRTSVVNERPDSDQDSPTE